MKDEQSAIIASNIRHLIDERGLKHSRVAANLGMTPNMFSCMLTGRKVIQASYLPNIVRAIGCSYNDLFRLPESPAT